MQLPQKVRKSLLDISERLRTAQQHKQNQTQWTKLLQQWCDYHDVDCGLVFNSAYLCFTANTIKALEKALAQLQQAPLATSFVNKDRFYQAKQSLNEDKRQGLKPSDSRILAHFSQLSIHALALIRQQANYVLDMDWKVLDLTAFNRLFVVENLDCFYQFYEQFDFKIQADDLVVYRGHNHYSKSIKALKEQFLLQQKACIYFGDFDSKGLNIALSEGYSHLLLPELAFMQSHANKEHHAAEQQSYFNKVQAFYQKLPAQHKSKALFLIHCQQRSLKQQWLTQTPLQVWPLK